MIRAGNVFAPLMHCTFFAIAIAALAPLAAQAQTEAATLRGVVHDATQAVVQGAAVTLENTDQNRSWKATTNDRGEYDIEQIPPGRYSLSIESHGFKKYVQPA